MNCPLLNTIFPESAKTNLVKVLQEVDYPALNLLLVQASGGGVKTDTLVGKARGELSNGSAADLEGCRCPDGTRHGSSSQRADDGGTEHDVSW